MLRPYGRKLGPQTGVYIQPAAQIRCESGTRSSGTGSSIRLATSRREGPDSARGYKFECCSWGGAPSARIEKRTAPCRAAPAKVPAKAERGCCTPQIDEDPLHYISSVPGYPGLDPNTRPLTPQAPSRPYPLRVPPLQRRSLTIHCTQISLLSSSTAMSRPSRVSSGFIGYDVGLSGTPLLSVVTTCCALGFLLVG
jgi:hypothetical protein